MIKIIQAGRDGGGGGTELTYRVEATGSEAPEFLHNYDMIDRRHRPITLFVLQPRKAGRLPCCATR